MDRLDALIHRIYEAALEPGDWPAILDELSDLVDGAQTHLVLAELDTGVAHVNLLRRTDPDGAAEYLRDHAASDFRAPKVFARKPGLVTDERAYVSEDEARASVIHRDFLPRHGIYNIAGANMRIEDCFGWFGISTRVKDAPFGEDRLALLNLVVPHVYRALRIARTQRELTELTALARDTQDRLRIGMVAYRHGTVTFANAAAQAIFAERFLQLAEGELRCVDRSGEAKLARLIRNGGGPVLLHDHEHGRRYLLRRHDSAYRRAAHGDFTLSIVESGSAHPVSLDEVISFCTGAGVTAAEAAALHASLTAGGLAGFASRKGIKLDTVRKQLKSALAKVDLGGQKQLHRALERFSLIRDD